MDNEIWPGIIHEYITEILRPVGVEVKITTLPWQRAVKEASVGNKIDGLLTAVFTEAPHLLLTNVPTWSFRNCFFAPENEDWLYEHESSLESMPEMLGAIAGYAYGEPIDDFITDLSNADKIQFVYGTEGTINLAKMLIRNRLALMIEDQNVYSWNVKNTDLDLQNIRNRGCLDKQPLFLAINPKFEWSSDLIVFLNNAFADVSNKQKLNGIIKRYLSK